MRVDRHSAGFSLIELLLAMAVGLVLVGAVLQLLIGDARSSHHLAQRFLLRSLQRRTLRLVRDDLASAASWELDPDATAAWSGSIPGPGAAAATPLMIEVFDVVVDFLFVPGKLPRKLGGYRQPYRYHGTGSLLNFVHA